MTLIDVVIAVRNEEESLPVFLENLKALPMPQGVELGCLFVEDGSTDQTRQILRDEAARNGRVKYIFLEKGRGQAPAIALGISRTAADAVIMMDVDGGHPLWLIPRMIDEFISGAVVVQAVRRNISMRSRYRDFGTFLFNRIYRVVSGIDTEKQNVYYRLVARSVYEELVRNNRWKHFLRINYSRYPKAQVSYIHFDAAERLLGHSKYNLRRLIRFAWIAVLSSMGPVRFTLWAGVALLGCSVLAITGWHALALIGAVIVLVVVVKFVQMSKHDVLSTFTIQESRVQEDAWH